MTAPSSLFASDAAQSLPSAPAHRHRAAGTCGRRSACALCARTPSCTAAPDTRPSQAPGARGPPAAHARLPPLIGMCTHISSVEASPRTVTVLRPVCVRKRQRGRGSAGLRHEGAQRKTSSMRLHQLPGGCMSMSLSHRIEDALRDDFVTRKQRARRRRRLKGNRVVEVVVSVGCGRHKALAWVRQSTLAPLTPSNQPEEARRRTSCPPHMQRQPPARCRQLHERISSPSRLTCKRRQLLSIPEMPHNACASRHMHVDAGVYDRHRLLDLLGASAGTALGLNFEVRLLGGDFKLHAASDKDTLQAGRWVPPVARTVLGHQGPG